MPVTPSFPSLPPPDVFLGVGCAGLKGNGRDDLLLIKFPEGTQVAGVFTRSSLPAAPVAWSRTALKGGRARCLVVNAGIANAATGTRGIRAVNDTVSTLATLAQCPRNEVFVASTGIIGKPLPSLNSALRKIWRAQKKASWYQAAQAITTTDAFPKGAIQHCLGTTLLGIAKGAGMIAPNMATTLCFVFTDARVSAPVLQRFLRAAIQKTFNAISVDGDTSTNDTVLLFATGTQKLSPAARKKFPTALTELLQNLALQVVSDGEGAQKLIQITVQKAASHSAAQTVARAIAHSPLIKIALGANSPNWGRVFMAVGKTQQKVNFQKLSIALGGITLFCNGSPVPHAHKTLARAMAKKHIPIDITLGVGRGRATIWTCDLNHAYITLNAHHN